MTLRFLRQEESTQIGYYLWLWRPIVYHQRYKVAEDSNFLVC